MVSTEAQLIENLAAVPDNCGPAANAFDNGDSGERATLIGGSDIGAFDNGAMPMVGVFDNGALPMFGAFDNGAPPRFGADAMLLDGAWTGAAARNLLGFEEVDGEGDEVGAIKPEGSIRLLICTTDMVLVLSATSRTTTAWSEPAAETIEIVSPFVMFTKPCWPLGSSVTWSSVFIRVGCETGKLWNFWTV